MISNGIIKMPDGTYSVYVMIQDGVEIESGISSEEEAVKMYQRVHLIMNHNENMVPRIYELQSRQVYELIHVK